MTTDTPEMVERVARVIDPVGWGFVERREADDPTHPALPFTRKRLLEQARAAIAAMREPTVKMMDAGRAVNTLTPDNALGIHYVAPEPAWYAMINEALR